VDARLSGGLQHRDRAVNVRTVIVEWALHRWNDVGERRQMENPVGAVEPGGQL